MKTDSPKRRKNRDWDDLIGVAYKQRLITSDGRNCVGNWGSPVVWVLALAISGS